MMSSPCASIFNTNEQADKCDSVVCEENSSVRDVGENDED